MKIPVLGAPEEWRTISGFPGYEASSYGQIRSFRSRNGKGALNTVPRILIQSPVPKKPYLQITLTNSDSKSKQCRVHQIIALAFYGLRPSALHDACHNDGNGMNNHAYNLRWDTKKANSHDRWQHGTMPTGSKSHLAKLTEAQVAEIKAMIPIWKFGMGRKLAQHFGVGTSTISRIKQEQCWGHV